MAWTTASGSASTSYDLLDKLIDFVNLTLGWTLHDDQRSTPVVDGDYAVLATNGESTTDPTMYMQIGATSGTNALNTFLYRYWDNATQTGYQRQSSTATITSILAPDAGPAFNYWFYGDKDCWICVNRNGASYNCSWNGKYTTAHPTDVTTSLNAETAGSDVVIEVADSSIFTVGNYYQIINVNEGSGTDGQMERIQVTAIDTGGTDITATLAYNHGSGAYIGIDPYPYMVTQSSGVGYAFTYNGAISSSSSSTYYTFNGTSNSPYSATDPDARQSLHWLWPFEIQNSSTYPEYRGTAKNIYGHGGAGGLVSEDTITVNGVVYDFYNSTKGTVLILNG